MSVCGDCPYKLYPTITGRCPQIHVHQLYPGIDSYNWKTTITCLNGSVTMHGPYKEPKFWFKWYLTEEMKCSHDLIYGKE